MNPLLSTIEIERLAVIADGLVASDSQALARQVEWHLARALADLNLDGATPGARDRVVVPPVDWPVGVAVTDLAAPIAAGIARAIRNGG